MPGMPGMTPGIPAMPSMTLPSESLSISGLPMGLTDAQLNAVFSQYGTVDQCKMLDPIPGLPGQGALVTMATVEEAAWLVQNVNNNIPSGLQTPVTVQFLAAPGELPISAPVVPAFDAGAAAMQAMQAGGAGAFDAGAAMQAMAALQGLLGATAMQQPDLSGLQAAAGAPAAAAAAAQTFQVGIPLTGTVKRWDDQKGFGFIVPDGGGPDVFVHIGDLPGGHKLVNGSQVVFEAMQDPSKGPGRYRAKSCSGGVPKEVPTETVSITDNLFITGLPLDISEETTKAIFSQYGSVLSIKKLSNQPGKPDAACLVRMGSAEQADWMVKNISSNIPTGLTTPVQIRFSENKGRGVGGGGGRPGPY